MQQLFGLGIKHHAVWWQCATGITVTHKSTNMVEKKTTPKAAKKATPAAAKKAPATKKAAAAKKEVLYLNEENAGFKAGDVYQALAAAGKALSLAEIAKAAKISTEDALLGIGWLFKEGKVKGEDDKVVLA